MSEVPREELDPHIYQKKDADAVQHLLRVTCGLDSQLLGETQILGQVSTAFTNARETGSCGPLLTYAFSRAAYAGKKARTQTEISRGGTSISHAAVTLLEGELGSLAGKDILVIGAGESAELAVHALYKRGATDIACLNRTYATAHALGLRTGCRARPWNELQQALVSADAVITVTGAPHAVIYADDILPVVDQREGRTLLIVDIAVPRDVEAEVASIPGVELHDIDELEAARDHNVNRRVAAIPEVEEIVAQETQVVMDWLHGREATELLAELRNLAKSVAESELAAALGKLDGADKNVEEVVERMANRIVAKLMHHPTKQLKSRASSEDFDAYHDVVVDLFGLSPRRLPRRERPAEADA
jgi:glutamyl-tRNA reductase